MRAGLLRSPARPAPVRCGEQPQFSQALGLHQVRVVDDRDEHFPGAMHAKGFLHEEAFAVVVLAVELDLGGPRRGCGARCGKCGACG